jgi:hypothetical protein
MSTLGMSLTVHTAHDMCSLGSLTEISTEVESQLTLWLGMMSFQAEKKPPIPSGSSQRPLPIVKNTP